jgi:subtilisin family serine protease
MDKQRDLTPSTVNRVVATLLLPLLLTVALWAILVTPVLAQDSREVLLYQESFDYDDYSKVPGWSLDSEYGGEVGWVVEGGQLRGMRHYWAVYEEGDWFNTHLGLTVFLHDGFEGLHISVRLSEVGRYALALYPDRVILFKQQGFGEGESFKDIGKHARRFEEGIPHGVSISVYEGRVLVVIDGVMEFDWVDPDPLPSGKIAFETLDDGWAEVDDVRVYGPAPTAGPDLSIVAADEWEFSEDGQTLVLYIVVANKGDVQARKTAAWARDPETGWESRLFPVPPLEPGEDTTVAIELEIPEDQRGFDHVFLVQVDPGNWVADESDRDNNERWTPPIGIPGLPELEEPYVEGIQPDRGRPGEEITVRIFGYNFSPEFGVFIPDLVEVQYVRFVHSGELEARIAIAPEAPAGRRPVWVGIEPGPVAVLEDGFTVLEPERAAQPDLTVSVSDWDIADDQIVVLHLIVRNAGDGYAGETIVRAEEPDLGWSSGDFTVPELWGGDEAPVEIRIEIPDEQRGSTHRFDVMVDPEDWIAESSEGNNTARTGGIPIPPIGEVRTPTERRAAPTPTERRLTPTPTSDRDGGGLDPRVIIVILVGGLLGGGIYLLRGRGRGGKRGADEKRPGVLGKPETYYYAGGVPVSIRRRDDLIAVKFRGIDSHTAAARTGVGADVPGFRPPAAQDLWPGGQVLLRQLPGEIRSPEQQQELFRALNQRTDVEHASFVYELNPDDSWIATDRFVAQFREGMSQADVGALNRQYGIEEVERIPWLPRAYLLRVTPASPGDTLSIANAYVEQKHAVVAHPDFLRQYANRAALLQPDAALAARHWHLSAIEAFEAWAISGGSPDVVVAIIDDGADVDHVAFPRQAGEHFNVIDQSGDPRPPAERAREYAHGTACAGLAVGAVNQEVGTSGVAPGCRLMAVRLLDRVLPVTVQEKLEDTLTDEEQLALQRALSVVSPYREARALQWASEHGADVISNSWGPPDGYAKYGKAFPIDDITRLALAYAIEHGRDGKGCVVCWAAGNGNESISFDGYASHPDVLAVGACTVEGKRAAYSDYGPEVAICAPGGGYRKGLLTTVDVDPETHRAYRYDFNGTSAAAPVVAGLAALVLSVNPGLTREEVYDILRDTADKIDPQGGQYDERGHSPFYGWGRVNARRAMQRAAQRS